MTSLPGEENERYKDVKLFETSGRNITLAEIVDYLVEESLKRIKEEL